jgi:hypothetical protein
MHSNFGSRIDRIYIPSGKTSWVQKFTTKAPCAYSDHKQIMIVLQPPTAIQKKRNQKLYVGSTEDFLAAQPLLSHLFKETEWHDMEGPTLTKRWDELKLEISRRLMDLKRIKGAIRKSKTADFLQRLALKV